MSEMDHTTRNAILELASQIGQPLRDELKASFFELAGHFELFRKSLQEISSSMNGSQDSLKLAANELLPKIETAKRELEIATEIFREAVQSLSEGFFEKLDVRIADIVNNSGKITESLSGELSYLSNDLRSVERVINENSLNLTDTSKKLDDTTVGLRKEIGNWNGLLRATSHAHSIELEALSTEISELMRNIETRLLEKVDEHINARDNRVRQDISKNNAMLTQLLTHTARLEKSLWFGGILVVAVIVFFSVIILIRT